MASFYPYPRIASVPGQWGYPQQQSVPIVEGITRPVPIRMIEQPSPQCAPVVGPGTPLPSMNFDRKRKRQGEIMNVHTELLDNHVRLISRRHGAIEVPWIVLRNCLVKMFANRTAPTACDPWSSARADEYQWRKYGQKLLGKGKWHRVYYRCTHQDCPAKKRTEVDASTGLVVSVLATEHTHGPPTKKRRVSVPKKACLP